MEKLVYYFSHYHDQKTKQNQTKQNEKPEAKQNKKPNTKTLWGKDLF